MTMVHRRAYDQFVTFAPLSIDDEVGKRCMINTKRFGAGSGVDHRVEQTKNCIEMIFLDVKEFFLDLNA